MTLLTIRIEGGLLSPDFLETIHDQPGQRPADFGLDARRSLVDEVTAVWSDVRTYWEAFERRRARARDGESLTSATREAWVIPLLEALGYRLTFQRRAVEVDGRSYAISHRAAKRGSRESAVGSRKPLPTPHSLFPTRVLPSMSSPSTRSWATGHRPAVEPCRPMRWCRTT